MSQLREKLAYQCFLEQTLSLNLREDPVRQVGVLGPGLLLETRLEPVDLVTDQDLPLEIDQDLEAVGEVVDSVAEVVQAEDLPADLEAVVGEVVTAEAAADLTAKC